MKLHAYSHSSIVSSGFKSEMTPFLLDDVTSRVKALFKVLVRANAGDEYSTGVSHYLNLGCSMFGMEYGLLLRPLSTQVAEVVAVGDAGEAFYVGQHLTIERTFAAEIFDREELVVSSRVIPTPNSVPACTYNGHIVNSYIGAPVHSSRGESLAVIFFASSYLTKNLQAADIESLELLAEGVACMNDMSKTQSQRKMTDQAMFAMGSVKTLEEYMEQARLPEVYGIPSRVVEVLRRRIGQLPLGIGDVADDLNLSKRTLQRRLQQQDISFADLRDQVRFHYSVDYLVKQHMSIDTISASLDFSDRTSFTNAFKRWTGLSPSTFRKLFRDYA
ncbi:MAG: helix-turn-helix domain-containing protein [Marinagarivorans sp.]|nr:helix-turn-helix domain-containing protein [Marinagarivorans sp.]